MTVPTHYGVLASGVGAAAGAAFVTEHHYSATGSQAVSFSGAAEGNLAVVVLNEANSTTIPAGWTLVGSYNWTDTGALTVVASKVLSAGDISTGSATFAQATNPSTVMAVFYSGVTVATLVSQANSLGTPLDIPGFVKSGSCKAIIGYCATAGTVSSLTPPGTMVVRIARYNSTSVSATLDDILTPSNYTDSSTITYTTVSTPTELDGALIELT